jgi:hypothetical protein
MRAEEWQQDGLGSHTGLVLITGVLNFGPLRA